VIGPFVIEPLSGEHDRAAFRCGSEALDRYFRTQLTQDTRRRITSGFVAVDREGRVAGFYILAATGVPITDLPAEVSRRLPCYPLLPAGLVGRLAVDQRCLAEGWAPPCCSTRSRARPERSRRSSRCWSMPRTTRPLPSTGTWGSSR
jgi:hypothetical protein